MSKFDDRLVPRRSTKTTGLQKTGKTTLLKGMPCSSILPSHRSCHRNSAARTKKRRAHQIRQMRSSSLLLSSTREKTNTKTKPTTTSGAIPLPTPASIAGKSSSGPARWHGGENQAGAVSGEHERWEEELASNSWPGCRLAIKTVPLRRISVVHKLTPATTHLSLAHASLSRSTSRKRALPTRPARRYEPPSERATSPARQNPGSSDHSLAVSSHLISSHGRGEAGGRAIPSRPPPARAAGLRAAPALCAGSHPPRCRARPARGGGRQGGRGGGGAGAEGGFGARGEEGVGAADVPGGRGDVQPRDHLHGRRRRLLPLRLANGGRRDSGDGDVRHLGTVRGRRGRDGVLGAVGAPGAVARLAVAHARVPPPAPRRALRAQRRLRHRQRRPRHGPPRLRLLQPRPPPGPLLRRGARDHAVRDGVHVRPRRPGPPPVPRRAHRERALLPAGRRRPPDSSHGQVRQRAVWSVPWPQGAGGGGRDGGAGEGDPEEDQEERDARRYAMRSSSIMYAVFCSCDCGIQYSFCLHVVCS